MKGKIEFGQFVDALVSAKGIVDDATRLEGELASMESRKAKLHDEIKAVAEDLDAVAAGASKQKIIIELDVIAAKKIADEQLAAYQKAQDDQKKAVEDRVNQALREAHDTLARAQSDAQAAVAAASAARVELAAIQEDLAAGRAAAERLSRFAQAGKA